MLTTKTKRWITRKKRWITFFLEKVIHQKNEVIHHFIFLRILKLFLKQSKKNEKINITFDKQQKLMYNEKANV